jgi:hypothetical protein
MITSLKPTSARQASVQQAAASIMVSLLFLLVLALLFSRSVRAGSNHDEDQFIASAQLLLDHSLLPYRDFAYFHTPNLVFIYAALFTLSEYTLFSARLFSVASAFVSVVLIFFLVKSFFKEHPPWLAMTAAAASVFFLLPNPLFAYTSGFAWNHDFQFCCPWRPMPCSWQAHPEKDLRYGCLPEACYWAWLLERAFPTCC